MVVGVILSGLLFVVCGTANELLSVWFNRQGPDYIKDGIFYIARLY